MIGWDRIGWDGIGSIVSHRIASNRIGSHRIGSDRILGLGHHHLVVLVYRIFDRASHEPIAGNNLSGHRLVGFDAKSAQTSREDFSKKVVRTFEKFFFKIASKNRKLFGKREFCDGQISRPRHGSTPILCSPERARNGDCFHLSRPSSRCTKTEKIASPHFFQKISPCRFGGTYRHSKAFNCCSLARAQNLLERYHM